MQKHQVESGRCPSYSFMEVLEMADILQNWPDITVLMDVLEMEQDGYSPAQQNTIGDKLQERYLELLYGTQ